MERRVVESLGRVEVAREEGALSSAAAILGRGAAILGKGAAILGRGAAILGRGAVKYGCGEGGAAANLASPYTHRANCYSLLLLTTYCYSLLVWPAHTEIALHRNREATQDPSLRSRLPPLET